MAHAKLLLRSEADIVDAITVIRLMESSFGFDHMKIKFDLIKENLLLGPTKEQMIFILDYLKLSTLIPLIQEEETISNQKTQFNDSQQIPDTQQNTQSAEEESMQSDEPPKKKPTLSLQSSQEFVNNLDKSQKTYNQLANKNQAVVTIAPSFNETSLKNFEALKIYYGSDGSRTFTQCLQDVQSDRNAQEDSKKDESLKSRNDDDDSVENTNPYRINYRTFAVDEDPIEKKLQEKPNTTSNSDDDLDCEIN